MESKIDYGHSLLQSRPNFAKALKDFETFLTATQDDLQRKFRILNEQRSNRKTSRNVKTYLTLQNFLLQKHVHRLNEFQTEILRRVSLIFANSDTTQTDGDQQFMQILADMSKMKTRCKHILDVTDRYCVLTEVNTDIIEDVVDGHLDQNTNEDSLHSNDSVNSRESAGGNSTPKLNGNVIKTTVTSVSSHLAVIAKTYTKRHSSSNLQSQQLNQTSTQSSDSTASR
jgi:hypothetical protein